MNELVKIKDVAKEFSVTPRTLRFYEDMGLIVKMPIDSLSSISKAFITPQLFIHFAIIYRKMSSNNYLSIHSLLKSLLLG